MSVSSIHEQHRLADKVGNLPTTEWLADIDSGEDEGIFDRQAVERTHELLVSFQRRTCDCESAGEATTVVHALVSALNVIGGMSGKHPNMFETDEREQLCQFIDETLARYHFVFDTDITEPWREW